MASKKALVAAVAVVVIVVVAGVLVFAIPMLNKASKPSTVPGTSFISTGTVGSSIGGSWQKSFYVSGGVHNPSAVLQTYLNTVVSPYGSISTTTNSSIPTSADASLIGYTEATSGSTLAAFYVYYPNSTAASEAYSNITILLQMNSSVILSTGTVSGAPYTFANATGGVNATQMIYSHNGNLLLGFLYTGKTAVSQSGMVSLLKNQLEVLGTGQSAAFPSQLVTESQVNSALSLNTNSYIYAIANTSNLAPVLNAASTAGLNTSSGTAVIESQFLGNLSAFGIATYADQVKNVTVGSAFLTFNTSIYSSTLYEELNTVFSTSSVYAPYYHAGTISGKQYFFVNISSNSSSPGAAELSLIVCVSGNSLIIQYTVASSVYGYQQLTALTAAQISDL